MASWFPPGRPVPSLALAALSGQALAVTVRRVRADCPRMTSCTEGRLDAPEHHVLLRIEATSAA